jgi:hypothetical protein
MIVIVQENAQIYEELRGIFKGVTDFGSNEMGSSSEMRGTMCTATVCTDLSVSA